MSFFEWLWLLVNIRKVIHYLLLLPWRIPILLKIRVNWRLLHPWAIIKSIRLIHGSKWLDRLRPLRFNKNLDVVSLSLLGMSVFFHYRVRYWWKIVILLRERSVGIQTIFLFRFVLLVFFEDRLEKFVSLQIRVKFLCLPLPHLS